MFHHWPYDEVEITRGPQAETITVRAPWLEAELALEADEFEEVMNLAARMAEGTLSVQSIPVASHFFSRLEAYPFSYILPAAKAAAPLDAHEIEDRRLLLLAPRDLLRFSLPSLPWQSPAGNAVLSRVALGPWQWDQDAALQFASLGDKIHPESLFTAVRRYHLLDVLDYDGGRDIFARIQRLDGEAFTHAAGTLIRQNHYVTEKCQDALGGALNKAGAARPLLADFMAAENGHDLILGKALADLSPDPFPVSMTTSALMGLLSYIARRNFLAFAMVIDFFERSTYGDTDPMAALLRQKGFEKAAAWIDRHKHINDAGGHDQIALTFLASMAPCEVSYAREALALAELQSRLITHMTEGAWYAAQLRPGGTVGEVRVHHG